MRTRLVIAVCLLAVTLLAVPAVALAWANGPDGYNSFGTHDWILQEANRLAASKGDGWVNLTVALPHTDDPDSVFHDFYYHVYERWNGHDYGNAPKKIALYYGKALAAKKAGNIRLASKDVGIMAHYYGDICNPLHTDQSAAEEKMHSPYEDDVDTYTDSVGENLGWIKWDGYQRRTSVAGFAVTTATASHKYYSVLVKDYNAAGMSSAVLSITAKSLNRAANGLADLLIGIKKGVKGGATGSGGGGSGGGGGTAPGSTIVYITDTGSCYHLKGCRYLAHSCIKTTLAKAKTDGYRPCSVCKPPT